MEAAPLTADALVRHEAFVLRLARSLVRNEASAEDIAQESLLSALEHRPPSGTLRSWLARVTRHRALDHLRGEQRRSEREARAARPEAVESGPSAQERLELEHRVVSAVLALDEPYRSVVIAAFYEGLAPSEIARRRRVGAGTVRSQLSRALAQLREKLDRQSGGDRGAWSAVLLGLLGERASKVAGSSVAAAPGASLSWPLIGAGTIAAGTLLWLGVRGIATDSNAKSFSLAAPSATAPSGQPEPETALAAVVERQPVEVQQEAAKEDVGAKQSPASAEAGELHSILERTRLLKVAILERAIEVDPAVRQSYAWLEAVPQAGLARLVDRKTGGFELDLPWMDGGGAYYSFTERVHDYQRRPQIGLEGSLLSSGFYGGSDGAVLELPEGAFRELASSPKRTPSALDGARLEAWNLMMKPGSALDGIPDLRFDVALRDLGLNSRAGAAIGRSYLVRARSQGEFDVAVVLEVAAQGADECTLAWKVLEIWAVNEERAVRQQAASIGMSDLPEELRTKPVQALRGELETLRARAEDLLLVSAHPEVIQRYSALALSGECGLSRLVDRNSDWTELPRMRGGGAYYSFATKSSSYDDHPDVELQRGNLSVGFAGADTGLVLDLGARSLRQALQQGPTWGSGPELELASGFSIDHFQSRDLVRASLNEFNAKIPPATRRGAVAAVGHSYLLRSIVQGHHDLLVAFEVLRTDEFGAWIAWQLVKSWPVPRER